MYRNRTCGELRIENAGQDVRLAGWVQRIRKMGGMTFLDLRDRYGITQVVFDQDTDASLCEAANGLGREFVVQVDGKVRERSSKNPNLPTGDIEIEAIAFPKNNSGRDVMNESPSPIDNAQLEELNLKLDLKNA